MKHTNDDDITLFIYINPDYHSLIQFYKQRVELHNNNVNSPYPDSGFDLGLPKDLTITKPTSNKIPLDICCSMYTSKNIPQPYYLYPRSSIIKTPLRLSNSVGIIDTGYRGTITAVVDNLSKIPLDPLFSNEYEFMAVLAEYFIESPKEFKIQFPKLYLYTNNLLNFSFLGY